MQKNLSISELSAGSLQNAFGDPREIGYISRYSDEELRFDRSLMKYYIPQNSTYLHLDLNVGYENTIKKPYIHSNEYLLKWIAHHSHFETLDRVDFVTSRGTIRNLMCTPYLQGEYDYWMICATRIGDTIYLRTIDRDEEIERRQNASEEMKRTFAWGYRFESYMTADRPDGVPDISSVNHEIEKYSTVITNKIGTFHLLMSAEIDAVNSSKSSRLSNGDPSCYIELKTSKMNPNFRLSYTFRRFKSMQWWAQSVVTGVEEEVCGLRDNLGIVRRIESFRTEDLKNYGEQFWTPRVCFNFCNNFLNYLSRTLEDDPRIVYKFEYVGGPHVAVSVLRDPEEKFRVIPEWYLAELQEHDRKGKSGSSRAKRV